MYITTLNQRISGKAKYNSMSNNITEVVRDKYGAVAVSNRSSEQTGVRSVAEAFGYTSAELASIPAEANMGLSCGNPTATANLREGETVVDLGSGGGLDVFLAAAKVGASGRAIGIDMTPEMIDLARLNAERGDAEGKPYTNVEFHLATIDNLPIPDASVDCVVSNCVINLATNKDAVFREIARVLKPGGRLAVSDIALKQPLPAEIADDVMAYVGCISGALLVDEFREGLRAAGFSSIEIVDSGADLNAYAAVEGQAGCCSPAMNDSTDAPISDTKSLPLAATACCSPAPLTNITTDAHSDLSEILRRYDVNDYAASFKIFALKEEA